MPVCSMCLAVLYLCIIWVHIGFVCVYFEFVLYRAHGELEMVSNQHIVNTKNLEYTLAPICWFWTPNRKVGLRWNGESKQWHIPTHSARRSDYHGEWDDNFSPGSYTACIFAIPHQFWPIVACSHLHCENESVARCCLRHIFQCTHST